MFSLALPLLFGNAHHVVLAWKMAGSQTESLCWSHAVKDQEEDQPKDGKIVSKMTLEEQMCQSMERLREEKEWRTEWHCRTQTAVERVGGGICGRNLLADDNLTWPVLEELAETARKKRY